MNKILFFLIGLLAIFGMMTYFENSELKTEITSIHKTLARRELVEKTLIDREVFLLSIFSQQLSATNIRVSTIENEREKEKALSSDNIKWMITKDLVPGGG